MVTNVVTWRSVGERKTANSLRISGLVWCHQESNRGHKDFQSFALPTELWHHFMFAGGIGSLLRVQSYYFFLRCAIGMANFFNNFLRIVKIGAIWGNEGRRRLGCE